LIRILALMLAVAVNAQAATSIPNGKWSFVFTELELDAGQRG